MTFRARLFLAVALFALIPLAYFLNIIQISNPVVLASILVLCIFTLLGAMAGAAKVDQMVKASQNRAILSEVELQVFMERIHEGVFQVNAEGRVRQVNTTMAEFLQYDPDFLKGKVLWDYLVCDGGAPRASFIPAGQKRRTLAARGIVKGGGSADLLVDLYIQNTGNRFDGFYGIARPTHKTLDREILKRDLMVALWRKLSPWAEEFVAELCNAVSSEKDPVSNAAALEKSAYRIRARLSSYFDKDFFLDWRPQLHLVTIQPRLLFEEVMVRLEPVARRRSCKITMRCLSEPLTLLGDPAYLGELLGILVHNALKYTPQGGDVQLVYRETAESHHFSVTDRGLGISREDLSRVFTPCFRADNAINKSEEGLGLGLWVAARIAEAHKGKLFVDSELGKGSAFTLFLYKASAAKQSIQWIG
ncbi:MAG: PAS domain-containing protein [Elusimicrobia bacterium]|nr:PAS domain-containing protein [Candidatus Obscuribacterium magneticum]